MSYAVSKAAAVQFGHWLSVTYGRRGIGVCLLCPQRTRTDMTKGFTDDRGRWLGRMIDPNVAASCCMDALREGRIYAFPHPEVETYVKRKAMDPDRWLLGTILRDEILPSIAKEKTSKTCIFLCVTHRAGLIAHAIDSLSTPKNSTTPRCHSPRWLRSTR